MVRGRVITLLLWLWLASPWQLQAGEYRLWLETADSTPLLAAPQAQAQLGQALTLVLWYQGPADLDRIAVSPWEQDFAVDRGYASREQELQRLRLRLTPRRSGALALPPLRLGGAQTAAHEVMAGAANESGTLLEPQWSVTSGPVWQRQELLAKLRLRISDPQARLETGDFHPAGFTLQVLPPSEETLPDGQRLFSQSWLLRPLHSGQLTLHAPVLRYVRDGVPLRRFHFPISTLQVQPLPAYVPPTVPVGRLTGTGNQPESVIASGVDAAALSAALQRAGLPGTVQQRMDAQRGTLSEAHIDWQAARPNPTGVVFFDPQLGRLTAMHPRPPIPAWRHWWWSPLPLLLISACWWQRHRLARQLALWRYRRTLLARLRKATNADGQARALLAQPLPGDTGAPRTPIEWAARLQRQYRLSESQAAVLDDLLVRLDRARFGDGKAAPAEAVIALLRGIRTRLI